MEAIANVTIARPTATPHLWPVNVEPCSTCDSQREICFLLTLSTTNGLGRASISVENLSCLQAQHVLEQILFHEPRVCQDLGLTGSKF